MKLRTTLFFLIIVFLSLVVNLTTGFAQTVVSVQPAEVPSPAVGEQLTVNLAITGGVGVAGYQITVNFDPTALRYVSSANADYLPAGAFVLPPETTDSSVTIAAASIGGGSANGDGTLATVTFEVVEVKTSTLRLTVDVLADAVGNSLDFTTADGIVTGGVLAQVVDIPDANLRAAIAEALNKAPGDAITRAEMETLVTLRATNRDIIDLRGIEFAINLTGLDLNNNNISDIFPLIVLTNLTELSLARNTISDISPLIGLINLEWLRLAENPIEDLSPLYTLLTLNPGLDVDIPSIDKITGPWLWMIAPTEPGQGGAPSTDIDSLSVASGGAVTEADVARNGANIGDSVGNYAWTPAEIAAAEDDTYLGNVNDVVNSIGFGEGNVDDHSAYALITLAVPTAQSGVIMKVGSDDPIKVWLNGEVVHTNAINRGSSDFQDTFLVDLATGENLLLVKVSERSVDWNMFVGIDADFSVVLPPEPDSDSLDVNGDGQITVVDLAIVALFYGTRVPAGISFPADVNADGVVDLLDLTAVAQGIDAAGGNDGINALSQEEMEAALVAAAEQAVDLNVIAEAPMRRHAQVLPKGVVYNNVANALAAAGHLGHSVPAVLQGLLELLTEMAAIPEATALLPNYPNPFNPETWIPYHLAKDAEVTLTIHDVSGTAVRALTLGHQPAGIYESRSRAAYWDGRNQIGEPVASGLYFYTLTAGEFTATRKLLIVK